MTAVSELYRGFKTIIPVGTTDGSIPVEENTVYDIASITKSIPTASLALLFAASKPVRFNLGGEVIEHLPELQNDYGATIEDLLRYRVYGPRMSDLKNMNADQIIEYIFERGFDAPPGDSRYTNLPAFLLGFILERIANESLDSLAQTYFFDPLKMTDTAFFPRAKSALVLVDWEKSVRMERMVPTEIDDWRGEVRGLPHDESAYVFAKVGRAVGHAGVFSSAPDLLNFAEALLLGELDPIATGAENGLGWEVNREWMGKYRTDMAFGKTGFTGGAIVFDRSRGVAFVILSNRTYPMRPPNNSLISEFRSDISDIIFQHV